MKNSFLVILDFPLEPESGRMSDQSSPTPFELYQIALDTRNMEIQLFWQRSNYFLVLNTASAVGFFFRAGEAHQWILGFFGLLAAALWFCVNLGSKFWQSRWEQRLSEAEQALGCDIQYFSASRDQIEGDVRASLAGAGHGSVRRWFDQLVLRQPSVSFMMVLLSGLFALLWIALLVTR